MKFVIAFKSPDAVHQALSGLPNETNSSDIEKVVSKYVKNGEYLIVEFDTEQQTAKVVPII